MDLGSLCIFNVQERAIERVGLAILKIHTGRLCIHSLRAIPMVDSGAECPAMGAEATGVNRLVEHE